MQEKQKVVSCFLDWVVTFHIKRVLAPNVNHLKHAKKFVEYWIRYSLLIVPSNLNYLLLVEQKINLYCLWGEHQSKNQECLKWLKL